MSASFPPEPIAGAYRQISASARTALISPVPISIVLTVAALAGVHEYPGFIDESHGGVTAS